MFFCHVSFRPRTTAALEEKCLSLPLLPPLGNKRERWDDGWRGDKRKEEGKDLVTLSVKCQNVLADCSFLTRPLAAGGRWGICGGVLLKSVRGTDKEISFVILSGGGKKKERDSDLKMFAHPVIRGEGGEEKEPEETEKGI